MMPVRWSCLATLLLLACGRQQPPEPPRVTSAEVPPPGPACELVCGNAQLVAEPAVTPDYTARATANADQVIGAMHDDLVACYARRLATAPNAHAFLTVDVIVGPDGRVRSVETTGGALLGDATMRCITERISRGVFEPPHGGGTQHIQVPFTLRRVGAGEAI